MSLTLLVVMVVAGVGGVVLAVHLSGGSVAARLADEEAALARFFIDYPDAGVRAVRLTRDGKTAFLALADGRVGIVQAVGDKFLTRVIAGPDLAGAPVAEGATLELRLRDFTWPGGTFVFAGEREARAAAAMLDGLRGMKLLEKS